MSPVGHTFHCWVVILAPRERCERWDHVGRTSPDMPGKFGRRGYSSMLNKCGCPLVHACHTVLLSHYQLHRGKVALK